LTTTPHTAGSCSRFCATDRTVRHSPPRVGRPVLDRQQRARRRDERVEPRAQLVPVLGMHGVEGRAADRLDPRAVEPPPVRAVRVPDRAALVEHRDELRRLLGERAEVPFARRQAALRLQLRRPVPDDVDRAVEVAVVVEDRGRGLLRPDRAPVAAGERDVVDVGGAALAVREPRPRRDRGLRLHEAEDRRAQQLGGAVAEQLLEASVRERDAPVGVHGTDAVVRGLDHAAVARLADLRRALRQHLRGDVDVREVRERAPPRLEATARSTNQRSSSGP
jgi:hypothetical protein